MRIGSLGIVTVRKGYCLYTGSALGYGDMALENRLKRHSRRKKKIRWHVDYLTSHSQCRVMAAICLTSGKRLECRINQAIVRRIEASPVLPGAGSSDCKCPAHLFMVNSSIGARQLLGTVVSVYEVYGGARFVSEDSLRSPFPLPISLGKRLERFE